MDYLILVDVVQSIQATEEYFQDFRLREPSVFLSQLVTCKVAFRAIIYFGADEFVRFERAMEFYYMLVVLSRQKDRLLSRQIHYLRVLRLLFNNL